MARTVRAQRESGMNEGEVHAFHSRTHSGLRCPVRSTLGTAARSVWPLTAPARTSPAHHPELCLWPPGTEAPAPLGDGLAVSTP